MIGYDLDIILFSDQSFWKLNRALEATKLDRNTFQRKIEEVNDKLEKSGIRTLEYKNEVLAIPKKIQNFEEVRFSIDKSKFILSESKRQALIYLLVFSELKQTSVNDFQDLLEVSRNTILSDIKKLRILLENQKIKIEYSRKRGFYLDSDEITLRQKAWYFLQKLSAQNEFYVLSKFLNQNQPLSIFEISQELRALMQKMKLEVVHSRYIPMILYVGVLKSRAVKHPSDNEEELFKALIIGMSDGKGILANVDFLYRVAFNIMENVMKLAAVEFEDFTKTFLALLSHLIPAYFRLKNHFELENVLLERIKKKYHSLFLLMDSALAPLKELVGKISESELAYFVILFGGEIYKNKYSGKPVRAIVLCMNGISSSLIMKKRLESLFPSMEFILSTSVSHFEKLPKNSYDVIFSTVPVKSDKKVYLMSVFPETEEENELYNQLLKDFNLPGFVKPSAQKILKAIEPYITIKAPMAKKDLLRIIDKKLNNNRKEGGISGVMLSDLLTKDKIKFTNQTLGWKEAIELTAQPMIEKKEIEEQYITAILNKVEEFGPYVDLGSGIALPHARPEDGVNQLGMSFLKCEHPVYLMDDPKHEIKIFIVLAAIDNETHLRALSTLAKILSNKEQLELLLTATTVAEVEQILLTEEGEK